MRRLLTSYAMHFNRRHGRVGHLFQNRYKSTVVESDRYLLSLVRYIHLNPLEAGLVSPVSALEKYVWCGHAALMGQGSRTFQNTQEVLARLGSSLEAARSELLLFMGDSKAAKSEFTTFEGGGLKRSVGGREALRRLQEDVRQGKAEREIHDERVLGRGDMVASLLQGEEQRRHQTCPSPEARALALIRLLEQASRHSGLSEMELRGASRRRTVVAWRRIVAYLGMSRLGASATEMAALMGLTLPTVLVAVAQAPELLGRMSVDVGVLPASLRELTAVSG
jgi:hypothetical protein